jgi:hypothetical protein
VCKPTRIEGFQPNGFAPCYCGVVTEAAPIVTQGTIENFQFTFASEDGISDTPSMHSLLGKFNAYRLFKKGQ